MIRDDDAAFDAAFDATAAAVGACFERGGAEGLF
jgi:hypothetical protein